MPKAILTDTTPISTVAATTGDTALGSTVFAPPSPSEASPEPVDAAAASEIADILSRLTVAPDQAIAVPPLWRIYAVKAHGRAIYVGVTMRLLEERWAAHVRMARRQPNRGSPGSLAASIREVLKGKQQIGAVFQIGLLAETSSPDEARRLEIEWIARLGTAAPQGCNLMKGGASLGGPANAEPVAVAHPRRGKLRYGSMLQAVVDTNRERTARGERPLGLYQVYARRNLGWSTEETLGLKTHADGRRKRPLFRWHGRAYSSLHDLAMAEGLPLDTIRSRLHRAHLAGCDTDHDVGADRRRGGARRTGGVGCGRLPPLALPHPSDPDAEPVDAGRFAKLTGVPKATVLHRYQLLLRQAQDSTATLTREEVLTALIERQERRLIIPLILPDGRSMSGGVRELIRQVLDDPQLKWSRPERWLGASAIRARLRLIPGWPQRPDEAATRWAFGFEPEADPRHPKTTVSVNPE